MMNVIFRMLVLAGEALLFHFAILMPAYSFLNISSPKMDRKAHLVLLKAEAKFYLFLLMAYLGIALIGALGIYVWLLFVDK